MREHTCLFWASTGVRSLSNRGMSLLILCAITFRRLVGAIVFEAVVREPQRAIEREKQRVGTMSVNIVRRAQADFVLDEERRAA